MALMELHDIQRHYRVGDETVRALDGVNLTIREGEFLAILGPSGSGKSTLMHILGFLDNPSSGSIVFDGEQVAEINSDRRARIRSEKIGFVFQAFNLLPRLTVSSNVQLPLYYNPRMRDHLAERAREALSKVGLEKRALHRPSQLSGGQRQRVAIARALINDPRILLADEPTGNLDSNTAQTIMDLFTALNRQGRTVVLVTHDVHTADYARRQVHVRDGRIIKDTAS